MKAINIGKSNMTTSTKKNIDLTERQPCWYANFENATERSKATWVVGVKCTDENDDEYSFKVSNAGDVSDEEFWRYASSENFAIELINKFKEGGKSAVSRWVKDGCPGFVKRGIK